MISDIIYFIQPTILEVVGLLGDCSTLYPLTQLDHCSQLKVF